MADLASLKIAVDSRSVDTAAADLDDLAVSAGRAEGATDRLAGTARTTSTAMSGMSNAVRQAQAAQKAAAMAVSGLGGSARLSANQMTNLSYQVQDLGVQLASGSPPMMAFMQQGSQIAGIMQASGMGVMGFTRAVIASTGAALGAMVVNPVFLAIAGSAAVVSAAVNFMADDISEASGTTVTAGDVMLGAFDILSDYVSSTVAAAFAYFGTTTGEVWDFIVETTRRAVNIITGVVSLIPRAFISAFEVVPTIISQIMSGDFMGAFDTAASASSAVFADTFRRDFVGEIGSVLRDAAVNRANLRAAEEAGEATGRAVARGVRKEAFSLGEEKQNTINKLKAEAAAVAALAQQYDRATAALEDNIRRGELELELQNLRAKGHEEVARMMEINYREEQALAELRANEAGYSIEQLAELERQTRELFDLQRGAAQQDSFLARQNEEAERLKKQGLEILALFERIAGTNGAIGDLARSLKTQFPDAFKAIGSEFKKLADKFGIDLGAAMTAALAGAQMGEAFAGISKSLGLPSSKTGGQIGGAIGGALGGPVGAAIGSVVGSVGVGLVKGVKKASATIEIQAANQVTQTVKGNKALQDAATGMANSLINGLKQVADALGGSLLEGVKISIGQRGSTFRVDPLGLGRTKGMEKFKTEEEAIAYAMQLAVSRGVITGIRESTQNLLRAGDDLQSALEDALAFEGVFDRLLEKTDPLAFGLQQLEEEFERLTAIFDKAGASAAEYADLQQLYELERQEILDKAAKEQLDKQREISDLMVRLYDAQGNAAKSLALTRELELQKASEAEQVILRLIYAQEDLNEANREAARITESLASLNIRLLQAQGRTAEATAASRAQELEGLSDSERTILRQIYLLEDLNARRAEEIQALEQAESNLRSVYEREKRTLEETAQKFRDLASALRDFSDTIFNTTRNPIQSLQALERQFFSTAREARLGNVAALEALPSLGGDLRDAVVDTATSRVEMIRKLAAIQRETDAAAEVAERQADNAMTQLEALHEQVKLLIDINDSVMSLDEAIREFLTARSKVEATNAQIVAAGGVAVGPMRISPAEEYAAKYFENVPNIKDIGVAMRYMSALAQQLVEQFGMPVGLVQQAHYAAQRAYSQADATSAAIASAFKSTIGFANGGMHSGGLRIVGENGPELEATGPTRIYNANQLGNMLNGGDTKEEVKALREEIRVALFQIAKNTGKTSDQLNRWDGDGLPSTRTWDAA